MSSDGEAIRTGELRTDDCTRIFYRLRGRGEPILFLHGFPTSGMLWDETARILSDRYACWCPDLPGWGESAPIQGRHGLGLLEASLTILEAFQSASERPIRWIASTDAGAVMAAYYAAVRPERVEKLVLMSAPLWPDFSVPWPMRILRTRGLGKAAGLLLKPLMFWRLGLEGRYLHRYTPEHRRSFSHPFQGPGGGMRLAERVRWGDPQEVMTPLSKMLPSIRARTLVVHCGDDLAVPESMARRTVEAIPDAELLTLPGPHFIPLTHPELVAERLAEFFGEEVRNG